MPAMRVLGFGSLLLLSSWIAQAAAAADLSSLLAVPVVTVTEPLAHKIVQASTRDRPYQFAVRVPMQVVMARGLWEDLSPDTLRWRLRVASPGAKSMSLEFARFQLPPGAQLWFHDAAGSMKQGPYTQTHQTPEGKLWTAMILGDHGVIELVVPRRAREQSDVQLGAIAHGFRAFGAPKADGRASGACNTDAICPQGDAWRDEIRSVAQLTINGTNLCTGQLVNNTLQNEDPLFITADHCDIGQTLPASSVVFYWNFYHSNCRAPSSGLREGDGSLSQNQSGSTLVARDRDTDFSLLRLNQQPAPEFNVHFAGWNASPNTPQSGASIHHPSGDVKMISLFQGAAARGRTQIAPDRNPQTWRVTWADGTTEPGSSGGGLWDQNHLIVGWLSGGNASCDNPGGVDGYGRMELAWNALPDPAQQLKVHLAPDGSDTIALGGKNASGSGGSAAAGEGGDGGGALGLPLLAPLGILVFLRRRAARLIVAALALTLGACATVGKEQVAQTKSHWIGKKITQVMKDEGTQPTRMFAAADGITVYVWSRDRNYTSPVNCTTSKKGYTSCYGGQTTTYSCELSAFADKKGIVRDVSASDGCGYVKVMGLVF